MMRAIQVTKLGGPEVLQIAQIPKPTPKSGELLVRNCFAGVNFIDTYHRTGLYPMPLPFTPGREASGFVEAVGENVTGFKIGDRIAYLGPGTYSEYTIASADRAFVLPENVSLEQGAGSLMTGLTTLMLTKETYRVKAGDTVLIHAVAGGVGQVLCQICKALGAKVIGTTSSAEKAIIAKQAGADEVILYTEKDVKAEVLRITNGLGCQVVYDGVGKSTFDASLDSVAHRGWLVCYGNASGKPEPFDILRLTKGSKVLTRPTLFDFVKTKEEFDKLSRDLFDNYLATGKVKIDIHKIYDLAHTNQSHIDLEGRASAGKLLLKIGKD